MMTNRERGAVTLLTANLLLAAVTVLILFLAQFNIMQSKIVANQNRNLQAFLAADAGLEFGISYLNRNSTTILASPVNGYINYGSGDTSVTNVALANGATFSVVYTNPTQNDYMTILVTSTGTSDDGTSVRVVKQLVNGGISAVDAALVTKNNFSASGNVSVSSSNYIGVHAGGTVSTSGSNNNISSISQNDNYIKNLTNDAFFYSLFGVTKAQMQAQSTYFATTLGINYSALTGRNWINASIVQSGNITVGSPSSPVLLVVNGSILSTGTMTVYGLLYVAGTIFLTGNNNFNGAVVAENSITLSGTTATYNSSLMNSYTTHIYPKVVGSWLDF